MPDRGRASSTPARPVRVELLRRAVELQADRGDELGDEGDLPRVGGDLDDHGLVGAVPAVETEDRAAAGCEGSVPAAGIIPGGAFSFNQYLVEDAEPLLFHTGPRRLFPLVREAVSHILPAERRRWIAFSHFEADECGSLNEWLAVAPAAQPLCSATAAMVSVADVADREPRALTDGETFSTGRRTFRWFDTPHLPHGWETGYLADESTQTLFCGDLFTQPGHGETALTSSDILGPSEAFRQGMDYYAHSKHAGAHFAKLAAFQPRTLAVMHGSAWQGDGAALLRELAQSVGA